MKGSFTRLLMSEIEFSCDALADITMGGILSFLEWFSSVVRASYRLFWVITGSVVDVDGGFLAVFLGCIQPSGSVERVFRLTIARTIAPVTGGDSVVRRG